MFLAHSHTKLGFDVLGIVALLQINVFIYISGLVTIRSFRVQPKFISELCDKIDSNTGAAIMLQSGSRWLGLTLDMIGSVIVFSSITIAIFIGDAGPASLGLLISYR